MFAWLAAGAVAVGLGVAMVSGAALAGAETDSATAASTSDSSATSESANVSSGGGGSEATKSKRNSEASSETPSESESADVSDARNADDESSPGASDEPDGKRNATTDATADDGSSIAPAAGGDTQQAAPDGSVVALDVIEDEPVGSSSVTTETADLTTKSSRAPPPAVVTIDEPADAAPQVSPWQTAWQDFVRQLQYTFFNKAPTLDPENGVQAPNGVVTGQLNGSSNNGYALTYSLTQGPTHGTVVIDQATGTYKYTPSAFDSRFTDSFVITADNGTAAKLPGIFGVVQAISHSFAQALGLAKADTVSTTIEVRSWFPNYTVGDPLDARYWAEQNFQDCVLMSVAMIEGQLRLVEPTDKTEEEIIELASRTPSVVDPEQMMWTGPTAEGVKNLDGAELLRMKGFDVDYRFYSDIQYQSGTYAQGQPALRDLKSDLAAGSGVFVAVNAKTLWTAEIPGFWNGEFFGPSNHAIVVLAVDEARGVVWINDSGLKREQIGKGAAVPLGAFMYAWAAGGYQTITASLKVAAGAEQEEALVLAA